MHTNDTLDPLVTALEVLRKIDTSSEINDYGNVVIPEKSYPDFGVELLREIRKLERVISESMRDSQRR
jgi:hypothetical protein